MLLFETLILIQRKGTRKIQLFSSRSEMKPLLEHLMDSNIMASTRERKAVALSKKFHQVDMGKSLSLYLSAIIKEEIFIGG